MACRRNIIAAAKLFSRNSKPLYTSIFHAEVNDDSEFQAPKSCPSWSPITRFLVSGFCNKATGVAPHLHERTSFAFANWPMSLRGSSFNRHVSSATDKGFDVPEVVTEKSMELVASAQGPIVSEVATAAADSFYPVAVIQHLVDAVHSITGFNWWVSIALTTILIRGSTTSLAILEFKYFNKHRRMMEMIMDDAQRKIEKRLHFKKIMDDMTADPESLPKTKKQWMELRRMFGDVAPVLLTCGGGFLFRLSTLLCLHYAIRNMAEKVPSFKTGGTFWFLDLSTPDTSFILPTLTSYALWTYLDIHWKTKEEDAFFIWISIAIFALWVPSFPKALFFYMFPSLWFSHMFRFALRRDEVRKFLGIPNVSRSQARPPKN